MLIVALLAWLFPNPIHRGTDATEGSEQGHPGKLRGYSTPVLISDTASGA